MNSGQQSDLLDNDSKHKITSEKFIAFMHRAFEGGYYGHDQNELIKSIVSELPREEEQLEKDFRIYSIDELLAASIGEIFLSEPLGPFRIEGYSGGKYCRFLIPDSPFAITGLNSSGFPFNKGIRKISTNELEEFFRYKKLPALKNL